MAKNLYSAETQQLQNLADGSSQVLCTIKSVFPFDFFPSTLVISKAKVDIIDTIFFFSKDFSSFMIPEIGRVEVSTNLFFSTITIHGKTVDKSLKKVSYLWPADAIKAQSIIQGLLIAKSENIDVTNINAATVESATQTLGQPME